MPKLEKETNSNRECFYLSIASLQLFAYFVNSMDIVLFSVSDEARDTKRPKKTGDRVHGMDTRSQSANTDQKSIINDQNITSRKKSIVRK